VETVPQDNPPQERKRCRTDHKTGEKSCGEGAGGSEEISCLSRTTAPTIAGTAMRNENLKASCGRMPRSFATLRVAPERETPGKSATACERPTRREDGVERDPAPCLREEKRKAVVRRKAGPSSRGSSRRFPANFLMRTPAAAVTQVATMMKRARRNSSLRRRTGKRAAATRKRSLRKKKRMTQREAKWRKTSRPREPRNPRNVRAKRRWPELLMGNHSATPWINPRATASRIWSTGADAAYRNL